MARTWVLVAESSRAKFYSASSIKGPLAEVDTLVHPESRMHEGDLVSDRPGSDRGGVGHGRHIVDDRTTARKQENLSFARDIAANLAAAHHKGAFNKLVLIAPPAFLGLLRENLSKEVLDCVTGQIDKNLVQQPAQVVCEYIAKPAF